MSETGAAISSILPVRNGEKYLEDLVPKILTMLGSNDELIVVNDGSTDQSRMIIEKFVLKDPRLILINTSQLGVVSALNLGIQVMKNDWVARFDVDDVYNASRLAEQRKYISEEVCVIFSDYEFISPSGKVMGSVHSAVFPAPTALSLISGQRTAHPSAIINRNLLIESGGYLAEDFPVEDLALWLRMSHFGKIISVPLPLLTYRISASSVSALNRSNQQKKKKELIWAHSLWLKLQSTCVAEFDQTLQEYTKMENAPERVLLHLRDLYLAARITGTKAPIMVLVFRIDFFMILKMIYKALLMLASTASRRFFRFIR